jgi:hypothetical protein
VLSQPPAQQQLMLVDQDSQQQLTLTDPPAEQQPRQLLVTVTRDSATLSPVSIRILRVQLPTPSGAQ